MSEIDEDFFDGIADADFADEIRSYPCLWDTSKKEFRKSKTIKANAWKEISTKFKTTIDNAQLRYKTLRTRISRYLKATKPSGSGTNDFPVRPEYERFRWMFNLIKSRNTMSNLAPRPSTAAATTTIESVEDDSNQDDTDTLDDAPPLSPPPTNNTDIDRSSATG